MFSSKNKQTKREVVGLDLGARQIKVVVLSAADEGHKLVQYVVAPTSGLSKTGPVDGWVADLQKILAQLGIHECQARVTMSCASATICETEVPRMPIEEVRAAFKLPANSMRYLRRDLSGYCLDAVELVNTGKDESSKKSPTMRILIAAAPREDVLRYRDALLAAKIKPTTLELSAISVVNAFHNHCPELNERDAVLLIDIGAQSTSINGIRGQQLLMARIMQFGGDQISEFVGSVLTLQSGEAEEEKLKMPDAVQPIVRQSLSPLAREIRSSIDFFERQQECHVTRTFACGGGACSPKILEFLSEEVGFRLECWDPVQSLDTAHFNGERGNLTCIAPSLAAAIGVATPSSQS